MHCRLTNSTYTTEQTGTQGDPINYLRSHSWRRESRHEVHGLPLYRTIRLWAECTLYLRPIPECGSSMIRERREGTSRSQFPLHGCVTNEQGLSAMDFVTGEEALSDIFRTLLELSELLRCDCIGHWPNPSLILKRMVLITAYHLGGPQ